jgi:CRISPR-associated protein Csy1
MNRVEAERLLRQADAAFRNGEFAAVLDATSVVLAHWPEHPGARTLRANARLKLESWQEAIEDLSRLLAINPTHAKLRRALSVCWLRIGNAHKAERALEVAGDAYRKALAADPTNTDARFNLGVLLLEGNDPKAAIEELHRVVAAQPEDFAAHLKLAEARIAGSDRARAAADLVSLASKLRAQDHLQECARLLLAAADVAHAKTVVARTIDHAGGKITPWVLSFCRELRRHADVGASRELLTRLRPHVTDPGDRLRIDLAYALGLPSVYPDRETLLATRRDFLHRLDEFVATYPPTRVVTLAPPPDALLWDNFLLAYQGENDREPQRKMGHWLSACLGALLPSDSTSHRRTRAKPRIALVSSRFHECTVGSYFASWVRRLGGSGRYEVILVHVGTYRDRLSEHLTTLVQGELSLDGPLVENVRRLRELAPDLILYPELGMDFRVLGLAALRLAPRQLCAWGHPVTSGLPTIDAFLSCRDMEPADAAEHYTEPLHLLPGLGTQYLTPALPSPTDRAALGLPTDRTLYLVPQSLFKLHPDNDAVYAEIAHRDPAAAFVFFATDKESMLVFVTRLEQAFSRMGLSARRHLVFLPVLSRADYLRVNLASDVMLDSLHWSGGNTSLDALLAGLPVVTCPGRFMRGRQSLAMLRALHCEELIAADPSQLASLAVAVAQDSERREGLAQRIRLHYPELTQSEGPLAILEESIESMLSETAATV